MPIRVANGDEFKRLLVALSKTIVDAAIHYKMFVDMSAELSKKPDVVAQSNTFWFATIRAHLHYSLTLLCKAYDQHDGTLHLRNWLGTIRDNLSLFDTKNFKERLKENPFVESLANSPRKPDVDQLSQDIGWCSNSNEIVRKLTVYRGNVVAHTGATPVIRDQRIDEQFPITYRDIQSLIDNAVQILNRYSSLYDANTYSTQIMGHDDFKNVISAVEEWISESK